MRPAIRIVSAEREHALFIGEHARSADILEVYRGRGKSVTEILLESLELPSPSLTALAGDEPIAMFGCFRGGTVLHTYGIPWMLGTPVLSQYPKTLVAIAEEYFEEWLSEVDELFNFVDAQNWPAIHFLRALHFTFGPPEPRGIDGALFQRFWRIA